MTALYLFVPFDYHVVAKVIEAQLVIGGVSNVAVICGAALGIIHIVDNKADGKTEETVNLSHPFGVAASKVIVYRYDMDTFPGKGVKVSGQGSNKCFTFAGFHFAYTALM